MFNEPTSVTEACLLKECSCLARALDVTKFIKNKMHDFGHTLLCYLSQTYMFNKPTSAAGTGRKKITKKCDQIDND